MQKKLTVCQSSFPGLTGESRKDIHSSHWILLPILFPLAVLITACASLEVIPSGETSAATTTPYSVPDTLQKNETLHFIVKGRDYNTMARIGNLCEDIYKKIMFDTNLFSFKPKQNYLIAVYPTQSDYHLATGYPIWSGGGTVTKPLGQILPSEKETRARTAIYTWEENATPTLLAHEISHLVLNEFMEYQNYSDMSKTYWINEGFATYEESAYYSPQDQESLNKIAAPYILQYGLPIDQMMDYTPRNDTRRILGQYYFNGDQYYFSQIDVWYWQVQSLVRYLIEKHGQYNFYLLMNAFKQKKSTLSALQEAYPGRWSNLTALEAEWKQSLK